MEKSAQVEENGENPWKSAGAEAQISEDLHSMA